jgi:hypothetical protein
MQKVSWVKKTLLALCLITTVVIFSRILSHQKKMADAGQQLNALIQAEQIIQLSEWDALFYFCYYPKGAVTSDSCFEDTLRVETKIAIPVRQFDSPTLHFEVNSSKESKPANTVYLKYKLTPNEREILKTSNEWVLLIPRNSQRATFLGSNMAGEAEYGHASDTSFGLSLNQLEKNEAVEMIVNFKGLRNFGPLDLPIALVKPSAARDYASLTDKQSSGAALSKQLLVGLPLVMGAVAAVLDHSPAMLMLAVFGAFRAVHTYFQFLAESAPLSLFQLTLSYMSLGASFALLLMFIEKLLSFQWKRIRVWHRIIFVFLCSGATLAGNWLDPKYQVNSTLWVDSASALFGLTLIAVVIYFRVTEQKKHSSNTPIITAAPPVEESILSKTLAYAQIALASMALVVHGSVNSGDLLDQFRGVPTFTDPLDWRHMMLMPALLTAGLLEVGSVAKRMLTFGQEMAEKAVIEKELKVGHDVQARMLPDKKFQSDFWKWRAFYHPAEALAGDWFDIREVKFADGRMLLALCLADVTGHGVGSSLSTSVICSHWSLWCSRLAQGEFPTDKIAREKLLCSAPLSIHEGLIALRKNENCTAMVALIDPYANEVSISSAGHPGALIMNSNGLRYVTTAGERLGGELFGEAKWNPKTEILGADDLLVIYSDGIVPVGITVLSWAGQLKKKILAGETQFERVLMKTLHENKRSFMKDPSNEDDMTLIMLRRGDGKAV